MFMGSRPIKEKTRKTRKNDLFAYVLIANIIQESEETTQKEN